MENLYSQQIASTMSEMAEEILAQWHVYLSVDMHVVCNRNLNAFLQKICIDVRSSAKVRKISQHIERVLKERVTPPPSG